MLYDDEDTQPYTPDDHLRIENARLRDQLEIASMQRDSAEESLKKILIKLKKLRTLVRDFVDEATDHI